MTFVVKLGNIHTLDVQQMIFFKIKMFRPEKFCNSPIYVIVLEKIFLFSSSPSSSPFFILPPCPHSTLQLRSVLKKLTQYECQSYWSLDNSCQLRVIQKTRLVSALTETLLLSSFSIYSLRYLNKLSQHFNSSKIFCTKFFNDWLAGDSLFLYTWKELRDTTSKCSVLGRVNICLNFNG
jgi:hypothetical protein